MRTLLIAAVPLLLGLPALAQPQRMVNAGTPAPECSFHVNFDRNADLPGYRLEQACLPFMPTNQLAPPGYAGQDFYVDGFTDAAIRARWPACKADPACFGPAMTGAKGFTVYEPRVTGRVDAAGRIDPEGAVDLREIRRPGYFGRAPYDEPVARLEPRTTTVEFTVPRDSFERLHLQKQDPIKLRGWYIQGEGVGPGRVRALVVMNNGGGNELTAIDDPRTRAVALDPATKRFVLGKFPDALSEQPGMRHWRGFIAALGEAGFDVLVTDRRGNGISGGVNGFNTAEQANDMFRALEQLDTGEGLRVLTPGGEVLTGREAGGRLLAGRATEMPVVLAGYSRGSYAVAWAMHKNFVEDCDRDRPDGGCKPPRGWTNIRGAILYGPNSGGLGYRVAGHDMIEAALRLEHNTTYYVDSDVFAKVGTWPGLLIEKGLWDYVEGMEGAFDTYNRAREPKDIFVFRGPHSLASQNPENMRLAGARMAAFAEAAVLGKPQVEGARRPRDLKELVGSSPGHWEPTTAPER